MNDINNIPDEKIRTLAATLRSSGLAASETEAIRMATSMTQTGSKVMKTFDERKERSTMGLSNLDKQYPNKKELAKEHTHEESEAPDKRIQTNPDSQEPELTPNMTVEEASMLNQEEKLEEAPEEHPIKHTERSTDDSTETETSQEPELRIENDEDEEFIVQDTFVEESEKEPEKEEETEFQDEEKKDVPKTPEREHPKKDISQMEESRVDLSSVFKFGK